MYTCPIPRPHILVLGLRSTHSVSVLAMAGATTDVPNLTRSKKLILW